MELYTSTLISNLTTPWGTRPETTVTGMSALDVLRLVEITQLGQGTRAVVGNTDGSHTEFSGPTRLVRDAQGNLMTAADIVRDSKAMATTPAAHQAWVTGMANALIRVLHDPLLDNKHELDNWWRAGVWWGQTVATPLSSEVAEALRAALPATVTDIDEGLSRMAAAADARRRSSRLRGTAIGTDREHVSRLRGTAIADDPSPHRGRRP